MRQRLLLDLTKLEHLQSLEEALVYMAKMTSMKLEDRVLASISALKTCAEWFPVDD